MPQSLIRHSSGLYIHRGAAARDDAAMIHKVWHKDQYRIKDLPYRPNEIVVDIGAHIGVFAAAWHEKNQQARIVCVEPQADNALLLAKNVGQFADVVVGACPYNDHTLKQLVESQRLPYIDVLKLSCEGSEPSLLRNMTLRGFIGAIVGRFHNAHEWHDALIAYNHWDYVEWETDQSGGLFRMTNPDYFRCGLL